jgi:hypothetical protein
MVHIQYIDGSDYFYLTLEEIFDDKKKRQDLYRNKSIAQPNINIKSIICSFSNIKEIPEEIGELINLTEFNCSNNKIKYIPKTIGNLINLISFDCANNKIKEFPNEIINCINLREFEYDENKITISENIRNFIDQINLQNNYVQNNYIQNIYIPNVYTDSQNVHSNSIQKSLKDSVDVLLKDNFTIEMKKLLEEIKQNNMIINKDYLINLLQANIIHTQLKCSYTDLFIKVYGRIINHENKIELFERFNEELYESINMCFTGKITRLINCLCGYYDDIHINISDNEQISNIILQIKNKYSSLTVQTEKIINELKERDYSKDIIDIWIQN